MKQRVVITGMSVLTPIGTTIDEFWQNSLSKKIGYDFHSNLNFFDGNGRVYGLIPDFEYLGRSSDSEFRCEMGRPTLLSINASLRAIQQAGVDINEIDKSRASIVIGNAISDTPYCESVYINGDCSKTNKFKKGMFTFIASEVAQEFDFRGEVSVMSTGCTAGIDAIGHSFEMIQAGEVDLALCGGVEAPISSITFASFEAIGALAKGFESIPKKASRPFDKKRNGFVLSEGAAILVLESLDHALKRKAKIWCEILAYDSCNNAFHMTDLKEGADSLAITIQNVLSDAGLNSSDISYINAHGSSTPQNDIFETATYKNVFGDYAYQIPINSTKSITGHPLGSASAIETVHTILAMNHSTIPPTANYEFVDEKCDLNYTPDPIGKEIQYALTNANGFSGIHSTLLLGKY